MSGKGAHLVEVAPQDCTKDGDRLHDHDEVPVNERAILETVPPWCIEHEVGDGASQDGDVGEAD